MWGVEPVGRSSYLTQLGPAPMSKTATWSVNRSDRIDFVVRGAEQEQFVFEKGEI